MGTTTSHAAVRGPVHSGVFTQIARRPGGVTSRESMECIKAAQHGQGGPPRPAVSFRPPPAPILAIFPSAGSHVTFGAQILARSVARRQPGENRRFTHARGGEAAMAGSDLAAAGGKSGRNQPGRGFAGSRAAGSGGDEGTRTPDPLLAKEVLSQLSYIPIAGQVIVAAELSGRRSCGRHGSGPDARHASGRRARAPGTRRRGRREPAPRGRARDRPARPPAR